MTGVKRVFARGSLAALSLAAVAGPAFCQTTTGGDPASVATGAITTVQTAVVAIAGAGLAAIALVSIFRPAYKWVKLVAAKL